MILFVLLVFGIAGHLHVALSVVSDSGSLDRFNHDLMGIVDHVQGNVRNNEYNRVVNVEVLERIHLTRTVLHSMHQVAVNGEGVLVGGTFVLFADLGLHNNAVSVENKLERHKALIKLLHINGPAVGYGMIGGIKDPFVEDGCLGYIIVVRSVLVHWVDHAAINISE
uniref:Putative secreted protein n=1 Tax=Anopheles marajoara TaxID=58244 RepID=A0A2M4C610_9DIPT